LVGHKKIQCCGALLISTSGHDKWWKVLLQCIVQFLNEEKWYICQLLISMVQVSKLNEKSVAIVIYVLFLSLL
jgi:hypothetical protein